MSGVKGRSGGPRENAGGAREGAGRPPKDPPTFDIPESQDPKPFLLAVMNDQKADARLRLEAAKALLPYMHLKIKEGGKKEEREKSAKRAAAGKFAPASPPKLVVNNA